MAISLFLSVSIVSVVPIVPIVPDVPNCQQEVSYAVSN
jgi:hypothetical protein